MPNKLDEKKEQMVDLVHPQTGDVIPTVPWVAENLLRQGWKRADDAKTPAADGKTGSTQTIKKDRDHGKTDK